MVASKEKPWTYAPRARVGELNKLRAKRDAPGVNDRRIGALDAAAETGAARREMPPIQQYGASTLTPTRESAFLRERPRI